MTLSLPSEFADVLQRRIESEASGLAREYGVDVGRASSVLDRAAREVWEIAPTEDPSFIWALSTGFLEFSPSLRDALKFLPAKEALDLFEEQDLRELHQRELFTEV